MKENKLIKILIPLVAIVVVFESIVLVTNLNSGSKVDEIKPSTDEVVDTEVVVKKVESKVEFLFETETNDMKVGKTYSVDLNLIAKEDLAFDGIEAYIKFDPKLVTISKLVTNSELPEATVSKVDDVLGLVKNVFLIDNKNGYQVKKGNVNKIMSFSVTPKMAGDLVLELSTGDEEGKFVTMIVGTVTNKALPYSSSGLEINITK